jgi:aspartyl-tRNA(Asn)/glutamyl-tRNA(Gln) amidotransferase subunit A
MSMANCVMNEAILARTVCEHSAALAAGEYTSLELTRAYLARIESCEGTVGAFLTVDPEGALLAARESDARRARGECRGALDGIPYAIKDNFCTRGLRTTAASRMLEDFVPPYDATVVSRLRAAGCVLLGKNNLDEFAMGSSCEQSALGQTRNPHAPDRVAGGSSGGSAAAVAALEAPFAIGSDTGGSVRQPAAFCGVLGFKPTYGLLSRYGMIALASSLDCVGLLARSVDDCALIMEALLGRDPLDATSCEHPFGSSLRNIHPCKAPLRVALVPALLEPPAIAPEVADAVRSAAADFRALGAEVTEIDLPSPEWALASYCVLSAAEASSNMARYDGIRFGLRGREETDLDRLYQSSRGEGLGVEVKRRILFGMSMLSEENRPLYYDRACEARRLIRESLLRELSEFDLILTPTAPTVADRIGGKRSPEVERRADLCAVYASLAGLPALSLPFGRSREGLPLAVQLTAAPYREDLLLRAARELDKRD